MVQHEKGRGAKGSERIECSMDGLRRPEQKHILGGFISFFSVHYPFSCLVFCSKPVDSLL